MTAVALATGKVAFDTLYSTTPAALYDATANKTFFVFLGASRGCYASYYDHATSTVATPVFVGPYITTTSDDHGAPSLEIDATGVLCVTWGVHNGNYYFAKSGAARSIATWSRITLANPGTYSNLRRATASGNLYIFQRSGTAHTSHSSPTFPAHEYFSMSKSTDNGVTWSAQASILDTTGSPEAASDPYVYDIQLGPDGKFWFAWTVARGAGHDGTRLNIHCAAWDPATETWTSPSGTSLGAVLDWTEHTACLVATAGNATTLAEAGTVHMAFDPVDGSPWLSYTDGAQTTPTVYVAHLVSGAWVITTVTTQAYTFGFTSLRFRADGSLDCYVPAIRATSSIVSQLERWNNATGSWRRAAVVALGTAGTGIERTQVPRNSRDDLSVFYIQNRYDRAPGTPTADLDVTTMWAASASEAVSSLRRLRRSGVVSVPTIYLRRAGAVGGEARYRKEAGSVVTITPTAPVAFTDSFTRADATTPGNGWTLSHSGTNVQIISNSLAPAVASGAATYYAFAGTSANTLNQYAQAVITAAPGGATTAHPHVGCRFSQINGGTGNTWTGYAARWNPSTLKWDLIKNPDGTAVVVASSAVDTAPTVPYTLRVEAVDGTITVKVGGTTKVTYVDTTPLTGGRRGGIGFRWSAAADNSARADDFAFGDL